MNSMAGEKPSWAATPTDGLHHAIVDGDTAWGAWRDAGLVVMDVADRVEAEAAVRPPQLVASPPGGSAQLPSPAGPRPAWWCSTRPCSTISRMG